MEEETCNEKGEDSVERQVSEERVCGLGVQGQSSCFNVECSFRLMLMFYNMNFDRTKIVQKSKTNFCSRFHFEGSEKGIERFWRR